MQHIKKKTDEVNQDQPQQVSGGHRPQHVSKSNPMQTYSSVGIPYKDIIQGKTQAVPQPVQQKEKTKTAEQKPQLADDSTAQATNAETTKKPLLKADFSIQGVKALLQRYAKETGQSAPKLSQVLSQVQVAQASEGLLEMHFASLAEKDYFDSFSKTEVMEYLKANLLNPEFRLQTAVAQVKQENVSLDKLAKYNRLKELNNDIDTLKDMFDLDLS